MGATCMRQLILGTTFSLLGAMAACSAGSGPAGGNTSVAVATDPSPTMAEAPVSIDPNDTSDLPANSNLPIVPTPALPGNVPINTIWINPSPEILFDVTGPVATDVFYNQLGSFSLINDLAGIVQTNPNFIVDHVTLIGRSIANRKVYNVTLYDPGSGEPFVVPVDDLLLATTQRVLLDGVPIARDKLTKIIWPALYVKALALYFNGYNANFSPSISLMTGLPYGPIQEVFHRQPDVIEPIVTQVNANTPVVTTSINVSQGETVTSVSPDDPNVTVMTAGYTFGCTQQQGLRSTLNICLQANTAHYVLSYDAASTNIRVRSTSPHNAGSVYDGLYGYQVDGSSVMPLPIFIRLTSQVKPLSGPLPTD